jgi:hypothetical protein
MYRKFIFVAGLVLASTGQAQTPDRTIVSHLSAGYAMAGTPSGTITGRLAAAPVHGIAGNRALLGQVENHAHQRESASFANAPIDGSRALPGIPSALPVDGADAEPPSSFRAEVRGDVTSTAWGEAEFGAVRTADPSSAAFVVSLGVCGEQSAVRFTRRSGAPLAVGRYRISEPANGPDEILALVLTGAPTRPTGVFRGESGWLVVTEASDRFTAGQFQVDAIGFVAAEPQHEDRHVNATGSFSATTGSSSFRVCENTE